MFESAAQDPDEKNLIKFLLPVLEECNVASVSGAGELKKLLTAQTGLHHQDQKILFKDKERDSAAYLDLSGVKDRSKLVMVEDPLSQERRFVEMRKTAKMERSAKAISEISLEVDRLAGQVVPNLHKLFLL